jgi:hypothetical protein
MGILVGGTLIQFLWTGWKRTVGYSAMEQEGESHATPEIAESEMDSSQPLSSKEMLTLECLAAIILPSDSSGPGAVDAGVVATIIRSLGTDKGKQSAYKRGLQAIDGLARGRFEKDLEALSPEFQHALVSFIDQADGRIGFDARTIAERVRRKLSYWYYASLMDVASVLEFWKMLREDVLVQFYSSRIAWDWLGYEGPPFPNGYMMASSITQKTEVLRG